MGFKLLALGWFLGLDLAVSSWMLLELPLLAALMLWSLAGTAAFFAAAFCLQDETASPRLACAAVPARR
ncbi:MAG: hypothetical protein ACKVPY_02135 [Paracoccaceae bacterium]